MSAHLLRLAHLVTRPGGSVLVAGANDRGMPSITDEMRRLFGNVSVRSMRKGHRLVASSRGPEATATEMAWPDPSMSAAEAVTVRGERLVLATTPLVFAGGRLDPAAALLAQALQVRASDTVLDLGCGAGIVGLIAARQAPGGHVYLLDSSYAATRTALLNAERNAIGNITALAGDGPKIMVEHDLHPDVIVTNPPFHSGQLEARQVADRFIRAAAACLAAHGRLYLVANRFLPYEPLLRTTFGQTAEVAGDQSFKVLLGERPRLSGSSAS
jgi:16S rRNA (guanine1207-N2)-methyltransferase